MKRLALALPILLACPSPPPEPRPVESQDTGDESTESEETAADPWFPKLDVCPPYYSDGGESLDG